ncbi:hypothetical protein AWN77_20465 [Clostridioides difficile]|nr:hypothetical protein AWN77_20465 [Clostridioides difficile]
MPFSNHHFTLLRERRKAAMSERPLALRHALHCSRGGRHKALVLDPPLNGRQTTSWLASSSLGSGEKTPFPQCSYSVLGTSHTKELNAVSFQHFTRQSGTSASCTFPP